MDIKRKYNVDTTLTAGQVCQLLLNGKVNNLPIPTTKINDITTVGTINDFFSAKIDETHILIIFKHNSASNYLYGMVVTIDSVTNYLTAGTLIQLQAVACQNITAIMFDNSKGILTYQNITDGYLYASVITVDGSYNISISTPLKSSSAATVNACYAQKINSTQILLTYTDANAYINGVVITSNGTTVSYGTIYALTSSACYLPQFAMTDATHAIIGYYILTSNYINVFAITISGTVLSAGTATQVNSVASSHFVATTIDSTHVFGSWTEGNNVVCNVFNLSGTNVTTSYVSTKILSGYTGQMLGNYTIDSTHFLVMTDTGGGRKYQVVTIAPSTQIIDTGKVITSEMTESSTGRLFNLVGVASNKIVLVCNNGVTTPYPLKAMVLTFNPTTYSVSEYRLKGKVLGVAQDTYGTVMLKGISASHSGLTIGKKYYYSTSTGIISTDSSGVYLGIAISDTKLYIPDYIIS